MLTLFLSACTVPLALAAGPPTDGTLSVKRGRGAVTLKVTGTIIGRVANGRVQIRDFKPGDGNDPQWSCKRHRISRQVSYCKGRNLGFRVEDGRFTVNLKGTGISISAVGHGRGRRGRRRRHGRQRRRDVARRRAVPVAAGRPDGLLPRAAAARKLNGAVVILRP